MAAGILHPIFPLAQEPAPNPGRIISAVVQLLERLVDWLHGFFPGVSGSVFHLIAGLLLLVLAVLLRQVAATAIFGRMQKRAEQGSTNVEEQLFLALIGPMGAFLIVCGIYAALAVFNLSPEAEHLASYGARGAATVIVLWGIFCAGAAALIHLEKVARSKDLGIAVFMPLIKKMLGFFFGILAILIVAESLGLEVKTFLAGLGIGGLAVALAAQDTIANMFGSFVVVLDHPFRVGDTVRIAGNEGTVEDIGLRSTRLRTSARTQIVMPNKLVASEAITNLSRMPQRRVDQTIGLTYDTTAPQLEAMLADLRALLRNDPGVHPSLIAAYFANYGESSLDIQIVYFTSDPSWQKHMEVRERVNLQIMRAVAARQLAFAFPTQTVVHATSLPPAVLGKS
jgi:MscS family membrane protein